MHGHTRGSRPLWERPVPTPPDGDGDGDERGDAPKGCSPDPRACGGGGAWRDDGRPKNRARYRAARAARAAHSPALMPAPRAHRRPRRCGPWPRPGRRDAPQRGREAGAGGWGRGAEVRGARGGPGHLLEPTAGAAGKVPQSGCARRQAPPGPLRPHVRPARGLPGLVVRAACAARRRQTHPGCGALRDCDSHPSDTRTHRHTL